jgi:16S rRNA (uracil1498-N3)-methyltransferase
LQGLGRTEEVWALIGPEGDFTEEEVALAEARGAAPTSLGTATLRSETAAMAALVLIHQHAADAHR